MNPLVHQLLIATMMVSATVVIHLVGLDLLQVALSWHLKRLSLWIHLNRKLVPLGIVLGLFALHGLEIWLYALVYWGGGLVPHLEQALYFSISAYSSLGESGTPLPDSWRVVGALEAINGMLLIGWSTAFLFQTLSHLMWDSESDDRLPRGAISPRSRRRGRL
jgi:hypothetical protein